jgi:hypothetical protein
MISRANGCRHRGRPSKLIRLAAHPIAAAVPGLKQGGRLMQISVLRRYVDRWSAGWAMGHRVRMTIMDMDEIREVTPMNQLLPGRRDRTDPSLRGSGLMMWCQSEFDQLRMVHPGIRC